MPKSIGLDQETNALDYLDRAIRFLREVEAGDLVAWKWAVIGLHGALYGFAVAAARGTNPANVAHTTKSGSIKLDSLNEVLEKCQDGQHMKMLVHSKPLTMTVEQREAVRILKQSIRDVFEHFLPQGWLLYLNGMPRISYRVLEVIKFLALETNTYLHLETAQQQEVDSLVTEGKAICNRIRPDYVHP